MEVILLDRVENIGQMGDIVNVKAGFARNYLLPQKKALRVNDANKKIFEAQRAELETRNLGREKEAKDAAGKINGKSFAIIRQASEAGVLYGSVSSRDIANAASDKGVHIARAQVRIDKPLKAIGIYPVRIVLHADVSATIEVNIARSEDEAKRQARGEEVLDNPQEGKANEEAETAEEQAPEFFDENAQAEVDSIASENAGENNENNDE